MEHLIASFEELAAEPNLIAIKEKLKLERAHANQWAYHPTKKVFVPLYLVNSDNDKILNVKLKELEDAKTQFHMSSDLYLQHVNNLLHLYPVFSINPDYPV